MKHLAHYNIYTENLQHLTPNIHNIIIQHSLKNIKRTTHASAHTNEYVRITPNYHKPNNAVY